MEVDTTACIFCGLISKKETNFVYEDDNYVAFEDIKPASTYHYLVAPKVHTVQESIYSCDLNIIKEMHEIGKHLLEIKDIDPGDFRFGFHVPPFYSINHLHLHAIAPVSQMNCISRLMYWPNSIWFMDVNVLLSRREVRNLND